MLPLASVHHHDHDEWIDILFCVNCQMLYWPMYGIYFPVLYGNKLFEIEIEIELNFWQKNSVRFVQGPMCSKDYNFPRVQWVNSLATGVMWQWF